MATIQLRRKTTSGTGPLVGVGSVKQGEPLVDLNGGNLYIAKTNKTGTSASPLNINDYLEFVSKGNLINVINGSINDLKLGTASKYNTGSSAGNVPVIDSDGKLSSKIIPQIALTNTFVVNSQSEMLKLTTAEIGNICIRNDLSKTFILKEGSYSSLSSWQELKTPTDKVSSVNGKTGAVNITLSELGGVSNSQLVNHAGNSYHLTDKQKSILTNVYVTDIKNGSDAVGVVNEDSVSSLNSSVIRNGIIINYKVSTGYDPNIKEIRMGINKDAVLTPSSVIDGGTF